MRRGMQGHVAKPWGPTRVLAWHGGDIYTLYLLYIGYGTCKHCIEELANHLNRSHLIYPRCPLRFLRVGLILLVQVMSIVGLNRVK